MVLHDAGVVMLVGAVLLIRVNARPYPDDLIATNAGWLWAAPLMGAITLFFSSALQGHAGLSRPREIERGQNGDRACRARKRGPPRRCRTIDTRERREIVVRAHAALLGSAPGIYERIVRDARDRCVHLVAKLGTQPLPLGIVPVLDRHQVKLRRSTEQDGQGQRRRCLRRALTSSQGL